jgi:type IV secretory pathway VirB10-like protein
MLSNKLAFAALAAACIAAAAGGGYLASRQNTVPAPVAATSEPSPSVAASNAASPSTPLASGPAERPVQETEAVVGDSAKPSVAPVQPPAAPPTGKSAKRTETPARPPARESHATTARRDPPPLTSSWPSSSNSQQTPSTTASSQTPTPEAAPAKADDRPAQEASRPAEPPQKTFEELVVSADSVIGLQNEARVTSETARVEDRVEARVTRDVKVGDRVAIPAGARAIGNVTQVERGGKFKERAKLGIRFHTLVLADGTRIPISTETIYREGDSPANGSAQKIGGGAVGGAILGAILGGAKGAAIGATAGAAGGGAIVAAGDRSAAVLQPGAPITVRILSPVTVTTEKE